jgi:PTS system N-acetylglucosamine-specific IIC component
VTEPIEFSFIFLAPVLYLIHAVLTGVAMVVMDLLGVKLGFGFSAGLFDYVLNYGLSTRPLLLIPVGLAYAAIYYFTFSWCIRAFDLKTPGREPLDDAVAAEEVAGDRGAVIAAALGGAANIRSVDACTTRLRLVLVDNALADEARLRALGARGVVRLQGGGLQVVLGPIADQVAAEVRAAVGAGAAAATPAAPAAPVAAVSRDTGGILAALASAGVRGVAGSGHRLHLIVGPGAEALGAQLRRELLG